MHNKINNQYVNNVQYCCRVPQGTCGLKFRCSELSQRSFCRVPQGTCGLKLRGDSMEPRMYGRVPQGTCGLKSNSLVGETVYYGSGPARDLWIEIFIGGRALPKALVGSRKGPVD